MNDLERRHGNGTWGSVTLSDLREALDSEYQRGLAAAESQLSILRQENEQERKQREALQHRVVQASIYVANGNLRKAQEELDALYAALKEQTR